MEKAIIEFNKISKDLEWDDNLNIEEIKEQANKKSPLFMCMLAYIYYYEQDDKEKAYNIIEKEISLNNLIQAQVLLSYKYIDIGNKEEYFYILNRLCFIMNSHVQYLIGNYYYKNKEYKDSYFWFFRSADQGNSESQYLIGKMLDKGEGVDKESNKAYNWYLKSAENGNPDAQHDLGWIYHKEKQNEKSYEMFLKSAYGGNINSIHQLYHIILNKHKYVNIVNIKEIYDCFYFLSINYNNNLALRFLIHILKYEDRKHIDLQKSYELICELHKKNNQLATSYLLEILFDHNSNFKNTKEAYRILSNIEIKNFQNIIVKIMDEIIKKNDFENHVRLINLLIENETGDAHLIARLAKMYLSGIDIKMTKDDLLTLLSINSSIIGKSSKYYIVKILMKENDIENNDENEKYLNEVDSEDFNALEWAKIYLKGVDIRISVENLIEGLKEYLTGNAKKDLNIYYYMGRVLMKTGGKENIKMAKEYFEKMKI